jgi:hypothetical protein
VNVRGKIERLERAVPVLPAGGEACALCALLSRGFARVYGAGREPLTLGSEACEQTHRNLLKVYGGGDGSGLKAAA